MIRGSSMSKRRVIFQLYYSRHIHVLFHADKRTIITAGVDRYINDCPRRAFWLLNGRAPRCMTGIIIHSIQAGTLYTQEVRAFFFLRAAIVRNKMHNKLTSLHYFIVSKFDILLTYLSDPSSFFPSKFDTFISESKILYSLIIIADSLCYMPNVQNKFMVNVTTVSNICLFVFIGHY